MKLEKKRITMNGEHNGVAFQFDNGELRVYGTMLNRSQIKTIIEIANLLRHEGYKLKQGKPVREQGSRMYFTNSANPLQWYDEED